ncbi:hypothetical protein Tco_0007602 [Tanacetum coccineum]
MLVSFVILYWQNTMAEQNVRLKHNKNSELDCTSLSMVTNQEKQSSFRCSKDTEEPHLSDIFFFNFVDILRNTNFFRAFSASASVPAIYIQQFWNSMKYDEKTKVYCCQVDEQWFNLSADLLRKALDITPVDPAHPFELPPTRQVIKPVERPRRSSCSSPITYGQEMTSAKVISKFDLEVKILKCLELAIPKTMIAQAIQQSSYYPKVSGKWLLRIRTKDNTTDISDKKGLLKRKPPQKVRKGKPSFQLVDEDDEAQQEPVPQGEGDDPDLELAKKMSLDAHQEKGEGEGADADIERAIKVSLDPSFLPQGHAPVGGVAIRDPVSETTPKLPEVVGKGKAIVTEEQVAHSLIDLSKKKSTTDQFILKVSMISSSNDSERTESGTEAAAPKGDKEQGEVASSTVTSGVRISVRIEDQAGSDPGKAHEALAGPDPEPMQEDQTGSDSGKVHPQRKSMISDDDEGDDDDDDEGPSWINTRGKSTKGEDTDSGAS